MWWRGVTGLRLAESWVRLILGVVWTAIVGLPFMVLVFARYLWGVGASRLGRAEVLNRMIDRNLLTFEIASRDFWARGILVLTRMSFSAREDVPIDWQRTYVICANHTSLFDIFALISAVPAPVRFVAKRELAWWPIVGWILKPSGQILVDRRNRDSAIRSIREAGGQRVRGQIIFFVEGTRSPSGELLPFKKGAFHFALANHLPLLPTAIGGAHTALGRRAWWNLNPGSEIEVEFCTPIETPTAAGENEESEIGDRLRDQTRAAIADALTCQQARRAAAAR